MELTLVQEQILTPFISNSITCLQSMAGLNATAGNPFEDDVECFWLNDYAIVVETSGVLEGRVVIHIYLEAALAISRKVRENLLGESADIPDVGEEVVEALSEYGNTVVGLATRELSQSDLSIVFDPPYFVSDMEQMDELFKDVKEIITVPIHIDGVGRFYLNYLLRRETEIQ